MGMKREHARIALDRYLSLCHVKQTLTAGTYRSAHRSRYRLRL